MLSDMEIIGNKNKKGQLKNGNERITSQISQLDGSQDKR